MNKDTAAGEATDRLFAAMGLGALLEQLPIESGKERMRLDGLGPAPSADLRTFHELLGAGRARAGRYTLHPWGPATMAVVQRHPGRERALVALRSIFCATALVAEGDDEVILASLAGAGLWETSKIYRATLGSGELQPTDCSLACWLYGELQRGDTPTFEGEEARPRDAERKRFVRTVRGAKLVAHLDPRALWRRCDWLVDAFFTLDAAADRSAALRGAAPWASYLREREALAVWPHLACYWLCAHYFLGNDEELEETMELATPLSHPAVVELRQVRALLRERPSAVFGRWSGEELANTREALRGTAPARLLGPGAKARRKARRRASL